MATLVEKIEYLLQDVDMSAAVEIRDDGNGMFIQSWNETVALRKQPTKAELTDISQQVDEWVALKNRPTEISYHDFWKLLSFPKRVQARNLAKALENHATAPDSTLMMIYEETLTNSVLDLTDAEQVVLLDDIATALKSAGILDDGDVSNWKALKPVA